MISQRVKVEEVGDVNVLHAELVRLAAVMSAARQIVIDLYPLHLEANVSMLNASVELCVSVNEIHGGDVMCDERQNFLLCFLVDESGSVGVVVL